MATREEVQGEESTPAENAQGFQNQDESSTSYFPDVPPERKDEDKQAALQRTKVWIKHLEDELQKVKGEFAAGERALKSLREERSAAINSRRLVQNVS